jgi:hypothetical protein
VCSREKREANTARHLARRKSGTEGRGGGATMTTPLLTYKASGSGVHVDLDRLVASRMLVQANSGGGKSRAIRQLLEETYGRVQHLVIDPEGEFSTLRERFDYILAAKQGGDTIASPKYAKRLCRSLVEMTASAVLDLYDLTLDERREFVRHFLTELMALPRALWHPIIVVIDEMHVFAPEAGQAQSAESVTSLATQGRKRGFCLVGATQRISKLHKDVAAELLNKMIGRTGLDIDVKRAGDELGMGKDDRTQLKTLAPGEFFVYGPAISNEVAKVKTGEVVTSHPEAGRIGTVPPPPSAKVRAMLARLADLPKEAEEEARTLEDFKRQNAELARKLRAAEKHGTVVEKPITVVDEKAVEGAVGRALDAQAAAISKANWETVQVGRKAVDQLERAATSISDAVPGLRSMLTRLERPVPIAPNGNGNGNGHHERREQNPSHRTESPIRTVTPRASSRASEPRSDLKKGQQKILNALAELETIGVDQATRHQLGMVAGYNLTGGTGAQHIADLGALGLVELPDKGVVRLTDDGRAAADAADAPTTLEELHERVLRKLPEGQRRIAEYLISIYPESISRAELGAAVNYNLTGGTGAQHVADLVTVGAARIPGSGKVVAGDLLFPESLV